MQLTTKIMILLCLKIFSKPLSMWSLLTRQRWAGPPSLAYVPPPWRPKPAAPLLGTYLRRALCQILRHGHRQRAQRQPSPARAPLRLQVRNSLCLQVGNSHAGVVRTFTITTAVFPRARSCSVASGRCEISPLPKFLSPHCLPRSPRPRTPRLPRSPIFSSTPPPHSRSSRPAKYRCPNLHVKSMQSLEDEMEYKKKDQKDTYLCALVDNHPAPPSPI